MSKEERQSMGPDHILDGAEAQGRWLILERVSGGKTKGGIIIPEALQDTPAWLVISKGKDVTIPIDVGERVIFQGGMKMELDSRTFCFIDQAQILAKLSPEMTKKYFANDAPHVTSRMVQ